MARNRDEEVPAFTGYVDDPDQWPSTLPSGVTKDGASEGKHPTWYAYRRTYADGRTEWQFFQRGTSPGAGEPDKVVGTVAGTPIKSVKEEWDKDETKETKQADQAERRMVREYPGTDPATGQPATVTEYESGPPKYVAIKPAAGSDPNDPKNRNEAELQRQREKNAALPAHLDPAYETDEERRKRADATIRQQGQDARQARIDEQNAATQAANAQRAAAAEQRAAAHEARLAEESKRPDTKVERRPINGVEYIVSITTPKDGSAPTARYFGPDGKPVSRLPSEGEASAGGPKMPDIIVGQSSAALTKYWEALAADPNLTPKQRADYFQQAVQTANIAVQDAATQQRDRESTRNYEYNIAGSKLNYLQSGLNQALDFVLKLNGALPEGSDLGGKAFGAILGLQMLQMERSGINDLGRAPSTGPGAPPPIPTLSPADLTNPQRLEARRAEIDASITASLQRPPDIMAPSAVGAPSAPSMTAPAPTAPAAPSMPGASEPPARANIPPTVPPAPAPSDAQSAANAGPVPGQDGSVWQPPAPPQPDYGAPGMRVLPQSSPPSSYGTGSDTPVSMAPGSDFAVLSQAQPPAPPQMPAPADDLPAMLTTRARSVPPWRLGSDEIEQMIAAGVPEDAIWSVPGVRV